MDKKQLIEKLIRESKISLDEGLLLLDGINPVQIIQLTPVYPYNQPTYLYPEQQLPWQLPWYEVGKPYCGTGTPLYEQAPTTTSIEFNFGTPFTYTAIC